MVSDENFCHLRDKTIKCLTTKDVCCLPFKVIPVEVHFVSLTSVGQAIKSADPVPPTVLLFA